MKALILVVAAAGCSSSLHPNDGGSGGGTGATGGTGTIGAIGGRCGGSSSGACAQGQGCLWECFGDLSSGQCVVLPAACDQSLNPVCGCNGATYSNECLLQREAVMKDHDGACVFTPASSGGDAQLLTGIWSGTGIRMNVTATGAAISFGCASGTIDQPLVVARFAFTAAGPLPRRGSWQGTRSSADGGSAGSVTYEALLSNATLRLSIAEQFWMLRHEDMGAPNCP